MLMYIGLLASFVAYIYFRIRYTLKIAKDQKDRSADAQYTLSVYSIFTLCIEVLCMAAMALFAGAMPMLDIGAMRCLHADIIVKQRFALTASVR